MFVKNIRCTCTCDVNLKPTILEAAENYVMLGEIADTMRNVFGEYK